MHLVAHSFPWNRTCLLTVVLGLALGIATLAITYFVIDAFRTELLAKLPLERVPAFEDALTIEDKLLSFILIVWTGVVGFSLAAAVMLLRRNRVAGRHER